MGVPTRLIKVGTSGRKSTDYKSDASIQTFVARLPIVASIAPQVLPIVLPSKAMEVSISINIIVAELTATTKTVSIGITGQPAILIDQRPVTQTGLAGRTGGFAEQGYPVPLNSTSLTYTLGSTDFADLEAELIVTIQGVEE